jgi:hypothetical protein
VVISLGSAEAGDDQKGVAPTPASASEPVQAPDVVRLRLLGANPNVEISGGALLPGKVNYFLGSDPAQWRTDLPTYEDIIYKELYPGINLNYAGTDGRLKGTYSVTAGADPGHIRWRYDGAEKVAIEETGNLRILVPSANPGGSSISLIEQAPVAWQEIAGRKLAVSISYRIAEDGSIGFRPGSYDPSHPLIIDPILDLSSYLGGSLNDQAHAIAIDAFNNIYVTGSTMSSNFPTSNPGQPNNGGGQDVFVSELRQYGSGARLLFSTYLGGAGNDQGYDITIDGWDNSVHLSGATTSTNFPTVNPYQPNNAGGSDAFVTSLSFGGSNIRHSTYLGGALEDVSYGIAVRPPACCGRSDVYVTGSTLSTNFPIVGAYQPNNAGSRDAFLSVFYGYGNNLFSSTYLGA